MLTVEIPHGGSGSGISKWHGWASGCLIAADLSSKIHLPCSSEPLLVGTMFHEYMRLWRSNQIEAKKRVAFQDSKCGIEIPTEWQDESFRLFEAYTDLRSKDHFGEILEVEQWLGGPCVEQEMGVSPYTGQVDLFARNSDGDIIQVDYKTSSRSGDYYGRGKSRIQQHTYWLIAKASGWDVRRIFVEQVVKTKTVQVHTYEIPIPTPGQILEIKRGLKEADQRKKTGLRTHFLSQCDSCKWRSNGHCV